MRTEETRAFSDQEPEQAYTITSLILARRCVLSTENRQRLLHALADPNLQQFRLCSACRRARESFRSAPRRVSSRRWTAFGLKNPARRGASFHTSRRAENIG